MITRVNGFADVCCYTCGSNTLMALGDTIVEVIIKNISNKNLMSVMDAILKLGDILLLLFNAIYLSLLFRFVQQVHKSHGTGFHLANYLIYASHQIVVGKHSSNTYHQTTYSGNHRFINAS